MNRAGDEAGTGRGSFENLLAALAPLLLVVVLYWEIVRDLVAQWATDPNYSHGFLVPIFSGYVAWQERERLARARIEGSVWGLAVLLFGLGILVLGVMGAELFLTRSSLIVVVAGLILFHAGTAVFRIVLFPLGFLAFMVPLPAIAFNAIAFPLQGLAAQNATAIIDALGIPVMRVGNIIHLSHITLGVAEACSGIRSLISLVVLAVIWAHLAIPGPWGRVFLVVSAVPITIIANAGRVVLTALIGQHFGARYAQGFFHEFSGWVIFLVAFASLLGVHGFIVLARKVSRRKGTMSSMGC